MVDTVFMNPLQKERKMAHSNTISCEVLFEKKKDNWFLVDIREKRECQNGTINNSP